MNHETRDFAIRDIGCVVCRLRGLGFVACEKHHLTTTGRHGNGKRRGERFTVGLNPWSHRGVPYGGMTVGQCRDLFGPSYAREPKAFRALYPDDVLLAEQNRLIAAWVAGTVTGVAA